MFSSIAEFISANAAILGAITVFIALATLISRQRFQFWWVDFCMTFPWVGHIGSWSNDTLSKSGKWMTSEEKLCRKYKPFISLISEHEFNESIEYMRNAGDLGRTPMPGWMVALLFLLVVAESLGFSYLLGTWMAREGSANTHTLLMFAIVLVLAIILVAITHTAGHQYYRTNLLRSCFQRYKEKEGKEFSSHLVALTNPQSIDADKPDYTRCINRVAKNPHDKGSYAAVWLAIIAIVVIATTSTVMRWKSLERELTQETTQQSMVAEGNPFESINLPADLVSPQQEANAQANDENANSTKVEGLSAFVMLGFIFVITQIVGMGAGYKYGFAGRETYKSANGANATWFWSRKDGAYANTGGFSTYNSYFQTFEPMMDLINGRLKELQHQMQQKAHENLLLTGTFYDYLQDHKIKSTETRYGLGNKDTRQEPRPAENSKVLSDGNLLTGEVAKAKEDISNFADDDQEQRAYFLKLPIDVQNELRPWLKQRKKEKEEAKQAIPADMDELF